MHGAKRPPNQEEKGQATPLLTPGPSDKNMLLLFCKAAELKRVCGETEPLFFDGETGFFRLVTNILLCAFFEVRRGPQSAFPMVFGGFP